MAKSSQGCIYIETSSRGKHSPKTPRFVAEISINGHRHRFRSTQLYPVQCWLEQKQREANPDPSP